MLDDTKDEIRMTLHEHLAWWGLKHFTSDADYFAWQRQQLSLTELNQLNAQVERKRRGDRRDEIAFYDLTVQSKILPVLYSQRYQYYREIGSRVASRMGEAKEILDFGCGVGILTTFYASRFPDKQFIGVDRSPASIAVARQKAEEQALSNVRFECLDVETAPVPGSYDLIIATQALVQAERNPGIPSQSWQTFERSRNADQQGAFEQRTGIGVRLDRLIERLNQDGRMIVFEKTRQLARRVPFQRALEGRGMQLIEAPEPIRYRLGEEVADDGPFYLLQKGGRALVNWDESEEPDEGRLFDGVALQQEPGEPNAPLYENHAPSAQQAWEQLKDRKIIKERTRQASDGRQLHVELGSAEGYVYLYCADSFDRRQLAIVQATSAALLEAYYEEILGEVG
ncbi:MAG: class I SAM-dependent methyltransferase [Nitrospiraceae bacterium]